MEKYILQILENNNRVIVPEFGAFIVKQRNPLTVIFNEFLQYNDGMLVDFVAKEKSISRDDAKQKIDEFVKEISSAMNTMGEYHLGAIGTIRKSTAGKISIEKGGGIKKTETKTKSKPAPKTKAAPAKAPEKKTEKTINKDEVEVKPEKENKQDETRPKASVPKVENQEKPTTASKPTSESTKPTPKAAEEANADQKPTKPAESHQKAPTPPASKTANDELIQKADSVKPETTARESSDMYPYEAPKTKRSRKNLILWIAIILIVNGLIIGYFIYSGDLKGLFSSDDDTELSMDYYENDVLMPDAPEDDAAAEQTSSEQEAAESEESATPSVTEKSSQPQSAQKTISGTKYYVVAGVFRNEQNADNLVIDLKKKGYHAEKFGTIGSLHAVSYEVFETKSEADRFLKKIQADMDPEAWIRIVK